MNNRYFEGEKIYFRPLEPSDAPVLAAWLNDPANWRTLGRNNPISRLREEEFLRGLYQSNTEVTFGIVVREGDELIGSCGLRGIDWSARSAEFGLLIGERRFQGLGFGTAATRLMVRYAFEELNLNRVSLSVLADNERGVRAYRRSGFVEEGRSRQAIYRNGRYHDKLHFAVLREEWETGDDEVAQDANLASMMI